MTLHPLTYGFFLLIFTAALEGQSFESWSGGLNTLLKNCSPRLVNANNKRPYLDVLRQCLQRRALIALDAVLSDDIIPVVNGIDLVRLQKENQSDPEGHFNKNEDDGARNNGKTWREIVFKRFGRIFRTHVLRIDLERLSGSKTTTEQNGPADNVDNGAAIEGRRRHHRRRQQLMPMMMMGLLVMGSILVPMGFQFLAVLGGKALILAKLALMLSSIQGLKRIATNGVNYGLYHSPVAEGWHERSHHEPLTGPYELPNYQAYQRP